jgi:hypothetical protein
MSDYFYAAIACLWFAVPPLALVAIAVGWWPVSTFLAAMWGSSLFASFRAFQDIRRYGVHNDRGY